MDLMNPPENFKECCDSLSCLHAIEHFGMGRYGDRVDLDGHVKGFRSLCAILKPGGLLDFSVPIGPDRIDFNASRVFFPFNPFWHWLRILSNLKLFSGNTFIRPWFANSRHPMAAEYHRRIRESEWGDTQLTTFRTPIPYRIQFLRYRFLPKRLFVWLSAFMQQSFMRFFYHVNLLAP